MTEKTPSGRRLSSATITLGAAGLLAVAAVAIAVTRSDETADLPPAGNGQAATAEAPAPSMGDAIATLNQQLREDPDNHQNWYLLGLAYRDGGNFADAERAFRRAMELAPRNADYTSYVGEMLLLQSGNNAPPPEAEQLFRRSLELAPGNPAARFYLATLKDSRGDHQGAVNDLLALINEAPAGAPWEPQVRDSVTAIAREHNINIEGRLPAPRAAPPSTATAGIPGPTREQMDAARGIPPSQQDEMVRGMVEGLANRLRQNPRDADGWIRLMRSRMVLNDRTKATEALNAGLAAFQGDAATQRRLRTAAEELGVPTG